MIKNGTDYPQVSLEHAFAGHPYKDRACEQAHACSQALSL